MKTDALATWNLYSQIAGLTLGDAGTGIRLMKLTGHSVSKLVHETFQLQLKYPFSDEKSCALSKYFVSTLYN